MTDLIQRLGLIDCDDVIGPMQATDIEDAIDTLEQQAALLERAATKLDSAAIIADKHYDLRSKYARQFRNLAADIRAMKEQEG